MQTLSNVNNISGNSLCSGRDFHLDFCLCGSLGGIFKYQIPVNKLGIHNNLSYTFWISKINQQEGYPSWCRFLSMPCFWSCLWIPNARCLMAWWWKSDLDPSLFWWSPILSLLSPLSMWTEKKLQIRWRLCYIDHVYPGTRLISIKLCYAWRF